MKLSLIVTDSGPLITLAVAGALDVLFLPGLPVIVPDMVRHEVIADASCRDDGTRRPCSHRVTTLARSIRATPQSLQADGACPVGECTGNRCVVEDVFERRGRAVMHGQQGGTDLVRVAGWLAGA